MIVENISTDVICEPFYVSETRILQECRSQKSFISSTWKKVFWYPPDKQKEKRLIVMNSIHEYSPILNAVIANYTDERNRLPKTLPIGLIDVSKIDHWDAILEIPDSPAENKIACYYRNSRREQKWVIFGTVSRCLMRRRQPISRSVRFPKN